MNRYDEDNPIQEVSGRSIFSRLKRFEEDDEYNYEKEMQNYRKKVYANNERKNNYIDTSPSADAFVQQMGNYVIFGICLIMFIAVVNIWSIFSGSDIDFANNKKELVEENMQYYEVDESELTDEYDNIKLAKLNIVSFEKIGNIPTLYKYDKNTQAILCNFTELDSRFMNAVNTIQIYYGDSIPESSIEKLKEGLTTRDFEYVRELFGGEVYAINTKNNCFMFVLIKENTIIYGAGGGEYTNIF